MIPEYTLTLRQSSLNRIATHLELVYKKLSSSRESEKKSLLNAKPTKYPGNNNNIGRYLSRHANTKPSRLSGTEPRKSAAMRPSHARRK
jgi:hypothetical protein